MPKSSQPPLGLDSRTRGYLPHIEGAAYQAITYRLADSLPDEAIVRLQEANYDNQSYRREIERYLNAGHGSCVLRDPVNAQIVIDNWLHFDGQDYELIAYVVMPNHAHVLLRVFEGRKLNNIIHSWKSYTAKKILRSAGGSPASIHQNAGGPPALRNRLWLREYWDRYIRDDEHYRRCIDYIHQNPVKAGLVPSAEQWPWSSAAPQ